MPIALAKVAIPVAYFTANASGAFHVLDDLFYYNSALGMLQRGYDAWALLRDPTAFYLYMQSMTGTHVGYHLWNLIAFSAFGPYYFSPVFLNVGATFVAGWFFVRILGRLGFSTTYRSFALAFFLLHWDVVAWSSFLNMKDVLAMTLTIALLHQALGAVERPSPLRLAGVALAAAPLFFLRFYVPVVVLTAILLHLAASRRLLLAGVATIALGGALYLRFPGLVGAWGQVDPGGLAGFPRFLMTPLPWNLTPGYEFLLVPSALHLLLLVPALAIIPRVWRDLPQARLLLLYLAVALTVYALVPGLQGVRQRFQVGFVLAWLQFHALWAMLRHAARPTAIPQPAPPARVAP